MGVNDGGSPRSLRSFIGSAVSAPNLHGWPALDKRSAAGRRRAGVVNWPANLPFAMTRLFVLFHGVQFS